MKNDALLTEQESSVTSSDIDNDTGIPEDHTIEELEEVQSEERVYEPRKRNTFAYGCYRFVKRCFDFFSSLAALLLFSWLILLCLLIKWLEDFHNPVYVSARVGKNGKVFRFYKFARCARMPRR